MTSIKHEWRFFRAGGFDQVLIDSGADLLALESLDPKLWVALSCPASGIEFCARTLSHIDSDRDGHIRAAEILAAVKWAGALLKDADLLTKGQDSLPLISIDDSSDEGKHLLAAARHILQGLNKPDATSITAADTENTQQLIASMRFNGDGIVTPRTAEDDTLAALIRDIMACCGESPDRSGEPGISADAVSRFFIDAESYAAWHTEMENATLEWPLGEKTLAAADAFREVHPKIDDYFIRCRLAAYDPRAATPLSRSVEDYQALAPEDLSTNGSVAEFPLAVVDANKPLPLHDALNPAWAGKIQALYDATIAPLFGEKLELTESEWNKLCAKFALLDEWLNRKPANCVEPLGIARIREILAGNHQNALEKLVEEDKEVKAEIDAITSVDKLVLYCRDLYLLVNNFVSFRNFYTRTGKAIFQAGTLYMDGRSAELCVRVDDVTRHASLANLSRLCLVYCECTRGADRISVAAAFTAGDSDQLMVGRNGVFYDRKSQDWDATIVRILEHPISIRHAFWAPYKRIGKMIGEQVQKLAAARTQATENRIASAIVGQGQKTPQEAAKAPPFDMAKFAGIFAAIGLAVGALGTAVASILSSFLGLKWWQMPLALIGLLLIVSGPAMIIAWFKLRERNLGPILDASGWAVNARAKINLPFGASLTSVAKLPEGTDRFLVDPFAEKKLVWPYYVAAVFAALVVLWVIWGIMSR
jgi:hypothetical protein